MGRVQTANLPKAEEYCDTVPCDEDVDGFDTQVMDYDDETQPVDLDDETQVMDMDLAGETQPMDDYEFIERMDTQLLDVSDDEAECKNHEEGVERTQILDETEENLDGSGDQISARDEGRTINFQQDDSGARTESRPSIDTTRSSGSLRRGFTAVRTASLRATGLAARKMALKKADNGSCSTEFSSQCSKLRSFNDCGGISSVDTVDVVIDKEKDCEKGLNSENQSMVARSLARTLFMEQDVAEEGSNDSLSGGKTDLPQFPASDNEMAGLSYVDSQEPGELSQANALEYVDKFLKLNVFESVQDQTCGNVVGEIASPGATAIGPQSLARQAKAKSTLARASVFDWDDTHEDEGGGEFFTKKKEVLLRPSSGAWKSCKKPQSSRLHEPRGSQSCGKFRNEKELQSIHDKINDFPHSDSKLVKSRKISQLEEINVKKKVDKYTHHHLGSDSCSGEAADTTAELTETMNVGIDTQMAAEAMEALSTGSALLMSDSNIADQDQKSRRGSCRKEATIKGLPCDVERACLSKLGVGTRSMRTKGMTMKSAAESKCSAALRTRSQYVVKDSNIGLARPKGNRRPNMKKISAENNRQSSGTGPLSIGVEERGSTLELNNNGSTPIARRTRQQITVNNLNDADDASGDSRRQWHCLDVVQAGRNKRKRSTRSDVAAENSNEREEALNTTTVTDSIKVDGSSNRERDLQHTPDQLNGSGKKQSLLIASKGNEAVLWPVARRTRSKSSARCAKVSQDGAGRNPRALLSLRDDCQLSPKKGRASSPLVNGAVSHDALDGSPVEIQKISSPANITPVNLKTPRTAVSPICVGDEYSTPSCKKRSLVKELYRLTDIEHECKSPAKDLRQRRDINSIRVLFSQHLGDDITRKQKKILCRLGVSVASSISDATHFVADMFVRTRNMLEAIANGKPVVTHQWLESCGQASCFIDEKNYILRDSKKERELGFSMPISLARASCHPLLEGRRVLVTPNIKPGKEIISSLVKAVHGQAIERLCRPMLNHDRLPDDLLVLSCEEDFEECVPLLEKGIAIYSSELLLNGIITQKLEYDRFRIFADHVKRTRSTLWLKKDGKKFLPVTTTK